MLLMKLAQLTMNLLTTCRWVIHSYRRNLELPLRLHGILMNLGILPVTLDCLLKWDLKHYFLAEMISKIKNRENKTKQWNSSGILISRMKPLQERESLLIYYTTNITLLISLKCRLIGTTIKVGKCTESKLLEKNNLLINLLTI